MRYQRPDSFKADYRRLSASERQLFRDTVRAFNEAADGIAAGTRDTWPSHLRVRSVQGAAGVFEMTWSSSGPDGRATWEWVSLVDAQSGQRRRAVRWRRVGGHAISKRP